MTGPTAPDARAPAAHPRVEVIPRYQPGRTAEATMAAHGLDSAVKLASNESPFGPLPGVPEAVAAATAEAGRYPDHLAETLRATLAARHGVAAEQVAVGCGSVGMLQQLLLSYAGPGHEVLFPCP
jgi:histidinol-phosphate aminotransferase